MEIFGFVSLPGWLVTIGFIILTLYLYSVWHHSLWRRLGVPGPKPVPYLGIITQIAKKGFAKTDLDLVKEYGDVVGIYMGHMPGLLVQDPEMIKEIFIKEFSNFTNRPIPFKMEKDTESAVGTAYDNHWKFLRSTLSPTFTSGKLKLMIPKIQRCCTDLVENIRQQTEGKEPIDMKELCEAYTMDVISSTAFGIEVNSQKDPNNAFVKYGKESALGLIFRPVFILMFMFPFLAKFMRIKFHKKEVGEFFTSVVNSAIDLRKQGNEKYNDFLQLMLDARRDSCEEPNISTKGDLQEYKNRGLNNLEIRENAVLFFIAGFDTTANSLAFTCYCLATNPDVQERVIEEIDTHLQGKDVAYEDISKLQYIDMFLNEVLRLYGAATRIQRGPRDDITIKGVRIPKGTDVSVSLYALHRNPKYWPDPEKFDPERFTDENKKKRQDYTFLPFGCGPRNCIGIRLALVEIKMAIVYLLQNFTFSTCEKTEIPIELENSGIIRAKNGIFLKVNKRNH